jgi:hypothetical protein
VNQGGEPRGIRGADELREGVYREKLGAQWGERMHISAVNEPDAGRKRGNEVYGHVRERREATRRTKTERRRRLTGSK